MYFRNTSQPGPVKTKLFAILSLALSLMLLLSPNAFAHTRQYVWTEEYRTIPKGGFEIENWVTTKVSDFNRSDVNSFQYEVELEYGLTDHWTIAHYQRFKTINVNGNDDSTRYNGFKFETKYRLGEKGKYWIDTLLYMEWITDPIDDDNPNELEAKIILSKDLGKFNITYNQIMESKLGSGGRTNHEFTFATSYEFSDSFIAGLEMKGDYWRPSSHRNKISLGPTLAYEHTYFWVAGGIRWGLNNHSDDLEARIIVGVPF